MASKKKHINKLKNTFVPHKQNNYRPHVIRHYGLALMIALLLIFQLSYNYANTGQAKVLGYATNVTQEDLLKYTNENRSNSGLDKLYINEKLNQAAQAKAEHMIANNYWSHYAPDGTTPWSFVNKSGYEYLKAGENLAYGFSDSYGTVRGWMNSKTHADNILDPLFSEVGFGIVNGSDFQGNENTVVVAMYAQPLNPSARPAEEPAAKVSQESTTAWTPQDTIRNEETSVPIVRAETKEISVLSAIISGDAHWGLYVTFVGITVVFAAYALRHAVAVKQMVVGGEHYVEGHPMLEAGLLYALLWLFLAATYGVIQ